MRVFIVLLLSLASFLTPVGPASADSCASECILTEGNECAYVWTCHPEYYVWQSSTPDWCLYQNGDRVAIDWRFVDGHAVIVAWRVIPVGDPAGNGLLRQVDNCGVLVIG